MTTMVTVGEATRRARGAGAGTGPASGKARRRPRASAVTVTGLVGMLVLGGCSTGDGGGPDGKEAEGTSTPASAPASPSASSAASPSGGTGSVPSAPVGELQGSWLATADGTAVVLVVTGTRAGLFATGGTVCSGGTGTADGARTIHLTCTDGNKDRASGTVGSVDGSTLTVDWSGGLGTETYVKAEGGRLPSGLPTAGLGS